MFDTPQKSKSDTPTQHALSALSALAQDVRLGAFRLLVRSGSRGVLAGDIADHMKVRQNTMSSNLSILFEAGLVTRSREGRNIRYYANMEGMRGLIEFLLSDCCGGDPDECASLFCDVFGEHRC